jgi:ABC-type multidrug transport system fused ATPase/permease subunit
MGMWGGHSAGGWSAQHGPGARTTQLRRSTDGWDDDELGKLYDHAVMSRLFPYLKPYKRQVIIAIIAMLIFAVASSLQPFLISLVIDEYIPQGDLNGVAMIGAAMIGLALLSWAGQYVQQVMTAYMGHNILLTLRKQMFGHIQKLSLSFLDRNEVGRVMSRVQNDVTVLQELLTTGLLTILADFVGLFLVLFFLLLLDVPLSLVTFTVLPVLIGVMAFWQARARKAFVRVRQAIAVVNSNLQENVSGVRVIQSLSREDENRRRSAAGRC